ncbi:MAG: rhodanese-like domain-containing protein [Lautropia sp.]
MKHLNPVQAWQFLQANPHALWIDCRSEAEYFLVGHPIVEREGQDPWRPELVCWADELHAEPNPDFIDQVLRLTTDRSRPVVLTCRSGRRSVSAGEALEHEGFVDVINVLEGFEGPLDERFRRGTVAGWRFRGLPWEQL